MAKNQEMSWNYQLGCNDRIGRAIMRQQYKQN